MDINATISSFEVEEGQKVQISDKSLQLDHIEDDSAHKRTYMNFQHFGALYFTHFSAVDL